MKKREVIILSVVIIFGLLFSAISTSFANTEAFMLAVGDGYKIVDTGQQRSYDDRGKTIYPREGNDFYGQDAQHDGNKPRYEFIDDDIVLDLVTGLMWQRDPGEKMSFDDAVAGADGFELGGFDDWRLPTIKELYSLIDFSGYCGRSASDSKPFLDTDFFEFEFGDESKGERHIDSQYWSSTEYLSTTMGGAETTFGVNFADGRIKGYGQSGHGGGPPSDGEGGPPGDGPPGQRPNSTTASRVKMNYVMYVRGNPDYGINDFEDNDDGTVIDLATGLMWSQDDSVKGMIWEDALSWVQKKNKQNYLGYSDWRLPNIKELQSIVDYTRCPDVTDSAAIDPIFDITKKGDNYPFFWSSTTHLDGPADRRGSTACYIAFGEARGYMGPPNGGDKELLDVHGAGAQRSDPKTGNPNDYPEGRGPQGDVIGIYNFVRLVRDAS